MAASATVQGQINPDSDMVSLSKAYLMPSLINLGKAALANLLLDDEVPDAPPRLLGAL